MESLSDTIIIESILRGEAGCFARLLEKYSKQVFTLIVRIVENREDAEELTQDVFLKAYKSLSRFRKESSFSTWLYRIAYNTAISATRTKLPEFVLVDEQLLSDVPDEPVFEDSDAEQRLAFLYRALEQIPPDERALITLFYNDNKSMEEIAEIMDLTETNVKTKMCRIRKKLFVLIKKMEEKQDGTE
jgi:RNA polymerase sigma-70 factor (ECF subfamily)